MTMAAGIGEKDADLAGLDAPGSAGILALHAYGLIAFLEKAGLIEHQHGLRVTEMLNRIGPQVIAHRISIPVHAREKILHAVWCGVTGRFRQVPAVLALERRQQPLEIGARPPARLDAGEARGYAGEEIIQLIGPAMGIACTRHGSTPPCQDNAQIPAVVLERRPIRLGQGG